MTLTFFSVLYKSSTFHVAVQIGHRWNQNVARTSVAHSAIGLCTTFVFLPHFEVICDPLYNGVFFYWNCDIIEDK